MSKRFQPIPRLEVHYHPAAEEVLKVGELAFRERRAFFEYSDGFLETELELSPLHLPNARGVVQANPDTFDGLFGLFDDSLPDGWGRLLLDRYVESRGYRAAELTPLDRLAWVGDRAVGALSYRPVHELADPAETLDLHALAEDAKIVLEDKASDALPRLLQLGGSPQGARPKAMVWLDEAGETVVSGTEARAGFTPYLVKFAAPTDPKHIGAIEYAYSLMAKAAGIHMPNTRLLGGKGAHRGFFAIERFDWKGPDRVHVHTASGLLNAPPGRSFLSYEQLLNLAWQLTRNAADVRELFRLCAFNVYAHNRDDHSRNIAFSMAPSGDWRLAPAYDLTFSEGPGGEHTMTVQGEGRNPTRKHLEALGKSVGLKKSALVEVLEQVEDAVADWEGFAEQAGVTKRERQRIANHHRLASS